MAESNTGEIRCVAIIPAFNEQITIGNVVRAALRAEMTDSVLVVNDGSLDNTGGVACQAADEELALGAKPFAVALHEVNKGKAEAMQTGFDHAEQLGGSDLQAVVFIDADSSPLSSRDTFNRRLGSRAPKRPLPQDPGHSEEFVSLLAGYIDQLAEPVLQGEKVMAIGMMQRNPVIDAIRLKLGWGALAGNRAVSAELWRDMTDEYKRRGAKIKGWKAEASLNTYTRQHRDSDEVKLNRSIGKILMPGVVNVGSRVKAGGLMPGLARMVEIHGQALSGLAGLGPKS